MATNLYERLCSIDLLRSAWQAIKAKNTAGGIDGITIADFDKNVSRQLQCLVDQLKAKNYKPQPYLRIDIPKKKGHNEIRKLSMLSIRDKIVQQSIRSLIEPRCEQLFLGNSYGFRQGKGVLKAIRRSKVECASKKFNYVLRLDIDNFFDTIDHSILQNRLNAIINDTEIVRLIMLIVKMGCVGHDMKWEDSNIGIPQGAILSPLLSNLYVHSFDQFMQHKGMPYVRYADDFYALTGTKEQAEMLYRQIAAYLKNRLLLTLNAPVISPLNDGFDFLGVTITRSKVSISSNKREELTSRISTLQFGADGLSRKSATTWNGICNYYGMLLPQTDLELFDKTLQKRLSSLIESNYSEFQTKTILLQRLNTIEYVSNLYIQNRKDFINELSNIYIQKKFEKKNQENHDLNQKIIRSRKLEFHRKEAEATEIIVNKPGTFIGLSSRRFTVKEKGKLLLQQPISNCSHIIVSGIGVSMSSNLLEFCMTNNIPVDFFNNQGKHTGSFLSPQFMENTLWLPQSLCKTEQRIRMATSIIAGKLKNQLNLAKYFHKYHKHIDSSISQKLQLLQEWESKFSQFKKTLNYNEEKLLTTLVGYESQGAIRYWAFIRQLLSDDNIEFETRVHKGATDLFNSMLNYGHSILYARIWQALLSAKLNPYDGLIHVAQAGNPCLVYDFIEIFRSQVVDRTVIKLVQKGHALSIDNNGCLTEQTKGLLVKNISERLNRYESFKGEELKLGQIITKQAKDLAQAFIANKAFKPYIAKW